MRLMILASKSPWPTVDGGRLALAEWIRAIAGRDVRILLVAPTTPGGDVAADAAIRAADITIDTRWIPVPQRAWWRAATTAVGRGLPLSVARHRHSGMATAVAASIRAFRPDVIHVEALQALVSLGPPPWPAPVVLRMQNVESDLWRHWPMAPVLRPLLSVEARRLAAYEVDAMRAVHRTLAITRPDAERLKALAPDAAIRVAAAPFTPSLPPGPSIGTSPVVVVPGSSWGPNRAAAEWAIRQVAPILMARAPQIRVVVFGAPARLQAIANTTIASTTEDSARMYPDNGIIAVPLFHGSGVRMRILEAWARGLPVVATSIAARGLEIGTGRPLLLADTPAEFAAAIMRIAADADLRRELVAEGRRCLASGHDPEHIGAQAIGQYRDALESVR